MTYADSTAYPRAAVNAGQLAEQIAKTHRIRWALGTGEFEVMCTGCGWGRAMPGRYDSRDAAETDGWLWQVTAAHAAWIALERSHHE
jgi:hypothetical protein